MIAADLFTIDALLDRATRKFTTAKFESPAREARFLLGGLLRRSSSDLLLSLDEKLDEESVRAFESFVERRLNREPAAYIVGLKNFMGYDFVLNHHVLVPRPETELLIEDLLMEARDLRLVKPKILDVGTGSGCIAISLALLLPNAEISALDVSSEALQIAAENVRRLDAKVALFQSDLFKDLPPTLQGAFDMIAANPPYIAAPDLPRCEPELSFEPRLALDGGEDGLTAIRRVIGEGRFFLKSGGLLAVEIGHNQGAPVQELLTAGGFDDVCILKDYNGHDRIAKGRKRGSI